jgi:hypothetical protein
MEVADAALEAAVAAQTRTSTMADEKFEEAIRALVVFEGDFFSTEPVSDQQRDRIASRMAAARARDRSRSNHRNVSVRLTLVTLPLTTNSPSQPAIGGQNNRELLNLFSLGLFLTINLLSCYVSVGCSTLLLVSDPVLEARDCCSSLQEVLWNFSRLPDDTRLTLSQNPHFYRHLNASREAYGNRFRLDPFADFQDGDAERFYVLTDRPSRIYIESGGGALAFGNVWAPRDAIIFKGS